MHDPTTENRKRLPGAGRLWVSRPACIAGKNKTATRVPHSMEDLCHPKCVPPHLCEYREAWTNFQKYEWFPHKYGGNTVSLFALLVTKGTFRESGCHNGGDSVSTATQEWEWIEASHCDLWQALWFLWPLLFCVTKIGCWKPVLRGY